MQHQPKPRLETTTTTLDVSHVSEPVTRGGPGQGRHNHQRELSKSGHFMSDSHIDSSRLNFPLLSLLAVVHRRPAGEGEDPLSHHPHHRQQQQQRTGIVHLNDRDGRDQPPIRMKKRPPQKHHLMISIESAIWMSRSEKSADLSLPDSERAKVPH